MKQSHSFILFGTINEGNAQLDAFCCFITPSIHNLSTFLVGISCVSMTLGKLGHGVLFIPFIKRRPAYFSSHLRCRWKATHIKWRSCSNFFDGLHLDACNCVWQLNNWLEICFMSLVSSVQVAHLACVLIGSFAKLSSSCCKRSVLAPCRWLMLSLARWSHQWLLFGFKGPLRYLTLPWFSTKNEVMLQLTILVVLNHIRFWIEPFAYRACLTWPRQVLDRTFCYQSLTVLNCIRFWIELLLSESCHTQQHQVLSRPFAVGAIGLLAPSQRYSTIEGEEVCWLWPEKKWLLEKVKKML